MTSLFLDTRCESLHISIIIVHLLFTIFDQNLSNYFAGRSMETVCLSMEYLGSLSLPDFEVIPISSFMEIVSHLHRSYAPSNMALCRFMLALEMTIAEIDQSDCPRIQTPSIHFAGVLKGDPRCLMIAMKQSAITRK